MSSLICARARWRSARRQRTSSRRPPLRVTPMPIDVLRRRARVSFTSLSFALAAAPALAAQQQLTLRQAVELAQGQGHPAHAAVSTREAARQRDRAFGKRLLPQVTLGGNNQPTVAYNSSIASI